jgi:hypothetical protein
MSVLKNVRNVFNDAPFNFLYWASDKIQFFMTHRNYVALQRQKDVHEVYLH